MAGSVEFPGKAVDPYLLWALITDFRGLDLQSDGGLPRRLTLVKLNDSVTPPADVTAGAAPSVPTSPSQKPLPWSKRFSIVIESADKIRTVIESTSEPIELSVPRRARSVDGVTFLERNLRTKLPILAVVDYGFAFAHENFRRWEPAKQQWKTRIACMWDQSFDRRKEKDSPPYGRLFNRQRINRLLKICTQAGRVDEARLYKQARYPHADRILTHGTHVLALAAGRPGEADCAATSDDLVLVQLPRPTVLDTSGASMTAQVLLALDFIQSRVPERAPLVVNLSYAAASGPHDGSTFLERAMDSFIASRSTKAATAIVLPAGNGYLSDGHAQVRLTSGARRAEIRWLVQTDDPTDSFVEIWYSRADAGADGLLISLRAPDGTVLGPVAPDHTASNGGPASTAGIVHRAQSIFHEQRSVALLALAPTAHDAVPRAEPGIWVVTIESTSANEDLCLTVDAWVQRDDTTLNEPPRVRQSRFVSNRPLAERDEDVDSDPVHRAGTSNGFSHGKKTVVVGGSYGSGGLTRYTAAALPGVAATRDSGSWPDVISAAETSEALPGLPSAGTRGSARLRMNGTSVAAPQVARALMTAFKKPPGSQPGQGKPQSPDPLSSIIQPHPQQQQQPPPAKPGLPNDALRCGKGSLIPTKKDC